MAMKPRNGTIGKNAGATSAASWVTERFQHGLALHQKGDGTGAEAIYREILRRAPLHADSLHLLGVARHQRGDHAAAAGFIRRAISLSPTQSFFHCNLGNVLKELGQLANALAAYREAIRLNPTYADAWYNLGVAQAAAGQKNDAVESYDAAIRLNPRNMFALNNRGNLLKELGQTSEAVASYDAAIQLNPRYLEALANRGIALQDLDRLADAIDSYEAVIRLNPNYADAHYNKGTALRKLDRPEEALASYDAAIRANPAYAEAYNNRGTTLKELDRLDEALASIDQTLRLKPDHADAHNNRGIMLHALDRPEEALASYDTAMRLKPDTADYFHNRGASFLALKRLDEALADFETAALLRPDYAECINHRGVVLRELERYAEALACHDESLRLKPGYASALTNRGQTLEQLDRKTEALESYDAAILAAPKSPDATICRANLLRLMKRFDEALSGIDDALHIKPNHSPAYTTKGNILKDMHRRQEALQSYQEAIRLKPESSDAHNNLGLMLQDLNRTDEALACFAQAIRLKPDQAHAFNNRANTFKALKQLDEALVNYDEALRLKPDYAFISGIAAHVSCAMGRWSDLDQRVSGIVRGINEGRPTTLPFALLALVDDPKLQRKASEIWVKEKLRPSGGLGPVARRNRDGRIHVAYLSADFQDHATTHLMAELLELHNRDAFTFTALSFGPPVDDKMRRRVAAAVDRFEVVNDLTDVEVAKLCRNLGVDIAVDLKGFTADARAGIFAERCAPVQINWLGYPGTMGAEFIDYIIADHTLIGPDDLDGYSEKVIWLPDSYQCNDGKRPLAKDMFTRADVGLPAEGFVFCCFNNNYKILPATFDVWMRILTQVPGSVLWLLEDNANVAANLRAEALKRGVSAERLVFAKRMPIIEHMARHKLADLFLDNWPCNAHTTASDALWTGLPVLTYPGKSFASRVAASLLTAVDMQDLIAKSEQDFEIQAVSLAKDSARLNALRARLMASRASARLFDCARFTRHIELAYRESMNRYWRGEDPDHINIANS